MTSWLHDFVWVSDVALWHNSRNGTSRREAHLEIQQRKPRRSRKFPSGGNQLLNLNTTENQEKPRFFRFQRIRHPNLLGPIHRPVLDGVVRRATGTAVLGNFSTISHTISEKMMKWWKKNQGKMMKIHQTLLENVSSRLPTVLKPEKGYLQRILAWARLQHSAIQALSFQNSTKSQNFAWNEDRVHVPRCYAAASSRDLFQSDKKKHTCFIFFHKPFHDKFI